MIADGFTEADRAEATTAAVEAGVRWVHLRDHAAEPGAFDEAARHLARRLRDQADDVLLSVNTRLAVAKQLDTGLHVGRRGPTVHAARQALGDGALIGFSAHNQDEAETAAGADYLFFSPVFPTQSKPGHPGQGLSALRRFCVAFPETPVFALGGITPERVAPCLDAGAYGVAVLSGILEAAKPADAARAYLSIFAA